LARTGQSDDEILVFRFNNPDKGAISHGIVHRALWEYLQVINEISDVAEQDKKRHEIFERYAWNFEFDMGFLPITRCSCQELVAEMVHTKDGSRAVREFVAQGTAKVGLDRWGIVGYGLNLELLGPETNHQSPEASPGADV
jgi:hypothetical protein